MPKLRLAKVYGFKGIKAISMYLNQERKSLGLEAIKLEDYFEEELEQR